MIVADGRPTQARSLMRWVSLPLLTLSLGLLPGCAKNAETAAPEAEAWVPAARTVTVTDDNAAEGKALFATCAGCHGADGEGKVGVGPRLNSASFLAAASDDFLIDTITKGRDGTTMIGWGAMYQPAQVESLVAHLRTLNSAEPVSLDQSPLHGDAVAGEAIFQSICAACHGRNGGGYMETANGTGIGRKAFLDSASDGFLRYIVKNGKDQTAMRPFDVKARTAVANLSDEEIENAIAYLRANAW